MKKIKKMIKHIPIVIIVFIILLSSLLVGTPLDQDNIQPVFIIAGVFCIIYYIIEKDKIIKDKIDIYVIILAFSTLIPLIFKTYVSLSGTIYNIMKYICVLNMFLITKHECQKNPKYVHIILNTIIMSILILCIFALDELWGNYLKDFRKIIGFINLGLKESRVSGLFSYANTMAITAAAGIFLCIGYILKNKNVIVKIVYIAISIIMLTTMILTYSRLTFIVFVIMSIIYILILCRKYKINKKIFSIFIMVFIVAIFYIIIGLQIPDTLNVEDIYRKKIFDIKADTNYTFSFEIDAKSSRKNNFVIKIVEYDEYYGKIKITNVKFDTFYGNKTINIRTSSDTTAIHVKIKNRYEDGTLNVKGMTLNGEEIILKYKILPTKLVSKIQEINFNQKSVWQRFEYIKDAFKVIKENWIFGLGGNAWRTMQYKVQEYNYYAKEVHSFPTQVFLENGVLGFISCLYIIAYVVNTMYRLIKNQEMDIIKVSAIIGVLSILFHSIFDFDMSFFYVLLIVLLIISTFENEKKEENKKLNLLQTIIENLILIITLIIIYISSVQIHYQNNRTTINLNENTKTQVEYFEKYQKLIPFDVNVNQRVYAALTDENNPENIDKEVQTLENIIKFEKYERSSLTLSNIYSYVESVLKSNKDIEQKLDFAIEYAYDTEQFGKYEKNIQTSRLRNLKNIIQILNDYDQLKYALKFNEQLKREIYQKEQCILDYKKSSYSKEMVEKYEKIISNLEKFSETFNKD